MKTKILHIINDLSKNGGAQKFLVDLVMEHAPQYDIKILVLCDDNDYLDLLSAQGIECFNWKTLSLKEKWSLLRWPDLVHGHLYPSIYLALLAVGKKRIQTEHCSYNRRRDYPLFKFMEHLLYRGHNLTVSISEKVQEELVKFMPHYQHKYRVVHNGVDLERFPMVAKSASSVLQKPVINIGMVGRLHEHKDHETLIRATALMPTNFELHLAGDGSKRTELQSLSHQLNIAERVHFHGIISDIPSFLSDIDVYVQSSKVEGFGLAAVEAMAAGLPVLSSDVPGLDEVMGSSEYLFDLGDSKQLAHKLTQLCTTQEMYNRASEYSVNRAKLYTIDKFRDGYYGLYQQLCTSK
ncbi:glycosyltransferase [Vibrio harveyi]|uniref:glycosyltransferase n=1 Tax=Vibrio harveyi TaxID=669 RepID=UPI001863BB93|nr:glycosyltransferase [Vibrio harveyi]EMB9230618.1 glycosyltransferase [Vibrio harveyi]